ncbi:hypothetical protein SCHPADRAFT_495530 [Schizopora paradoxa]|uniref:Uncharacterized protein n=1 Tax=Schizopora paradoxa TaxID=27342 RepID=A0A0H2RN44_9AGAM|nr:hypothetical protein SCHPADRAFT_495530 [Schizopora paradoxa]
MPPMPLICYLLGHFSPLVIQGLRSLSSPGTASTCGRYGLDKMCHTSRYLVTVVQHSRRCMCMTNRTSLCDEGVFPGLLPSIPWLIARATALIAGT